MVITLTIARRRHHRYVFVSLFLSYRSPVVVGESKIQTGKLSHSFSLSLSLSHTLILIKNSLSFSFPTTRS
jgi:hypothetical protein